MKDRIFIPEIIQLQYFEGTTLKYHDIEVQSAEHFVDTLRRLYKDHGPLRLDFKGINLVVVSGYDTEYKKEVHHKISDILDHIHQNIYTEKE